MTETKRQTKVLSPPAIKIAQKKRGVVSSSKNPQTSQMMTDLLKNCEVSLVRSQTLDGAVDAYRILACWQKNIAVVLMIGFDTTGEGHKKINLTVHLRR